MRATVTSFNLAINNYQTRTENDIAISFSIVDGQRLKLSELLVVDLPNLVVLQSVVRVADRKTIAVKLGAYDLHDLNLPSGHGTTRSASSERLAGV